MGILDKLKGAMNTLTGGSAKVTLEYKADKVYFPGDQIEVKVTATSTGAEVKSKGIFIDISGRETVRLSYRSSDGNTIPINQSETLCDHQIQIAPDFVLAPNETKVFSGTVQVPMLQPSYDGKLAQAIYEIRGRVESFGNDPDSKFAPIRIGRNSF